MQPRLAGQVIAPHGSIRLFAGDSCEVVAEPHTIRIETFIVTDAMRDADKVRFAYTSQLADENRTLQAQVGHLQAQLLAMAGLHEPPLELPNVTQFLGPLLEEQNPEADSKDET